MRGICILFMVSVSALYGATDPRSIPKDSLESMLEQAKKYYYNADYEQAIAQLGKAIQFLRPLNSNDLVEAHTYLAFSYVAFGDKKNAMEQFKRVLTLKPDLELDPASISPKIIKVFEETKAEMAVSLPAKFDSVPSNSPVAMPGPVTTTSSQPGVLSAPPSSSRSKAGALVRSCIFPGWGQRYAGKMGKGNKLTISAGLSLGGSVLAKSFGMPAVSGICGLAFVGIYAYNVGDIIFDEGNVSTSMTGPGNNCLSETFGAGVRLWYTFGF